MKSLQERYDALEQLSFEGEFVECVEEGKNLITHPDLSPYLPIKTACVVAAATDDWDEGELHRRMAETAYRVTLAKTSKAFDELRAILDQLKAQQEEADEEYESDDYGLKHSVVQCPNEQSQSHEGFDDKGYEHDEEMEGMADHLPIDDLQELEEADEKVFEVRGPGPT